MKKLICALIGAASLVASATTYIQTSATGTAPWKPVKDSVSLAHLADSALHAPPSAYADSSRASGLADSAKRAGWAPLDTVEIRNFIWRGVSTAHLHLPNVGTGAFLKMANDGSDSVVASHFLMYDDSLLEYRYVGNSQMIPNHFRTVYNIGDASYGYAVAYGWPDGISFGKGYGIGSSPFDTLFRIPDNGPVWSKSGYRVLSGTAKGFLKADGSVDSSGVFTGVADTAKKSGTSGNSLALGGIAASQYGTLAQDTLIAKKVASDTATVLRAGIASAITTSEAYATARISDSLTANTRAWTTLAAAKSSIHDSLTVERTFDSLVSRNVAHDTATSLRTYVGSASTTGNAATATKLATARTISMTGDGAWSTSFDGSANATGPLHLARLLASGSAGSASSAPTLTWDTTGRLTSVGSAAISIPHTQVSDWGTYINQPLLTTGSPTFATVTLSGANALNLTANGSGPYMRSVLYQDTSGVYIERGLASESGSASPLPFYISKRGGGTPYPFIVNTDNVTTNTMLYANGGISGNLTGHASLDIPLTGSSAITGPLVSSSSITANGLITANGGIIGQGNVGSYDQPWNAGYFSVAGIDIGGGLLTFNSPSASTVLLGVTAHPMVIAPATGSVAFPAGIGLNGPLGLSVVSVGGTTYSASAHRGRILTIAPSTTFTLPLGSDGDWFIIQGSAAQGQHQDAGTITPSGTSVYIRGIAYSSSVAVVGTLIAYCNGVYWYIG